MTNSLKAAIATLQQIALDLETVPRTPDGNVDGAIKNLRMLARHAEPYKRDMFYPAHVIESYRLAIYDTIGLLEALADTPGGTLHDAIADLKEVRAYLKDCKQHEPDDSGAQESLASIQIPPSLRGEPAEALEEPARVHSLEDQKSFAPPQPTEAELLAATGKTRMFKKDASKGEGIVQACAQIRGAVAGSPSVDGIRFILQAVDQIEAQAFSKDTPTFALNANGNPLDDQQVSLIERIKEAQASLLALGEEAQSYLLAKQKRLRAICDADPVENYDCDDVLTEAQQQAYGDYKAFSKARGYAWLERGLDDVQVGVMGMVRAVAGPTS